MFRVGNLPIATVLRNYQRYLPVVRLTNRINASSFLLPQQGFHSTPVVFKRKTGSQVNEYPRRFPSKKQRKKRAEFMEIKRKEAATSSPKETNARQKSMESYVNSEEFKRQEKEVDDLSPAIWDMIQPEPKIAPSKPFDHNRFKLEPNVEFILEKFSAYKMNPEEITLLQTMQRMTARELAEVDNKDLSPSALHVIDDVPAPSSMISTQDVYDANYAIQYLIHAKRHEEAEAIYKLLKHHNLPLEIETYTALLTKAINSQNYEEANNLFDFVMASDDLTPTVSFWEEKIRLLCYEKKLTEGMKLLRQLKGMNVPLTIRAYNSILGLLVSESRSDSERVMNFWCEMHEDPSLQLNAESFKHMIHYSSTRGEVERAFFYFDELKTKGITPTMEVFVEMIRASARAPYWVDGYQDTITDALVLLESHQIYPNTRIYNEIISAYSLCGDAMAAEYYYWEMTRKGIPKDEKTFQYLLDAFAKSQSIGAPSYGWKGRFMKLEDRPKTEREEALRLLGPKRSFELFNAGLDGEIEEIKGGRRLRVKMEDLGDDPGASKEIMKEAFREAKKIKLMNEQRRYLILSGLCLEGGRGEIERHLAKLKELEEEALSYYDFDDIDNRRFDEKEKHRIPGGLAGEKSLELYGINMFDLNGLVEETRKLESELGQQLPPTLRRVMELLQVEERKRIAYDLAYRTMQTETKELLDPFSHFPEIRGLDAEALRLPEGRDEVERRLKALQLQAADSDELGEATKDLLPYYKQAMGEEDIDTDESIDVADQALLADPKGETKLLTRSKRRDRSLRMRRIKNQVHAMEVLDGDRLDGDNNTSKNSLKTHRDSSLAAEGGMLSEDEIDYNNPYHISQLRKQTQGNIDMIEYGRIIPPNYDIPLNLRREINKNRATLFFTDGLHRENLEPTEGLWNAYIRVFTDSGDKEAALDLCEEMEESEMKLTAKGYEGLVLMYVRKGEIDDAMSALNTIKEKGIIPTGDTYGYILRSLTHRGMLVEALKLLEEATEKRIKIHDRDLKYLRNRCNKLGVRHPDFPPDPYQWVKDIRKMQADTKQASNRRIQKIKSLQFISR